MLTSPRNVGGEQLESALINMNSWGRIVGCGMISQYNLPFDDQYGVKGLMAIVAKRLTIRGFIVSDPDMGALWKDEHRKNVSKWLKEGSMKALMSETVGMENAATGLVGIFHGENFGKAILKIKKVRIARFSTLLRRSKLTNVVRLASGAGGFRSP